MKGEQDKKQLAISKFQTTAAQHPQFVMALVMFSLMVALSVVIGTIDATWITPQAAHGVSNGP